MTQYSPTPFLNVMTHRSKVSLRCRKSGTCGEVGHERLIQPRITMKLLLTKQRSFSNIPAFLDLHGSLGPLISSEIFKKLSFWIVEQFQSGRKYSSQILHGARNGEIFRQLYCIIRVLVLLICQANLRVKKS